MQVMAINIGGRAIAISVKVSTMSIRAITRQSRVTIEPFGISLFGPNLVCSVNDTPISGHKVYYGCSIELAVYKQKMKIKKIKIMK